MLVKGMFLTVNFYFIQSTQILFLQKYPEPLWDETFEGNFFR